MNKKVKIMLGIIVFLILILGVSLFINYTNSVKNYNHRKIIQTTIQSGNIDENLTQNNTIELEDLSIKLASIKYFPEGGNNIPDSENVLDFTIDFESKNDLNLNLVTFDYLMFDENNKILNTSLWGHPEDTKNYIRGFVKDKYQEKFFFKFVDYCIFNKNMQTQNITENLKKVSKTMSSSLNQEIVNPKKINIRIVNLKYQFEKSELKTLSNTDLEFILNLNETTINE